MKKVITGVVTLLALAGCLPKDNGGGSGGGGATAGGGAWKPLGAAPAPCRGV